MRITLVSSSGSVSDVLDEFVARFCYGEAELHSITDPQVLNSRSSISELKAMTDFFGTVFNTESLVAPKRNSRVSLSNWIARVLLSAREIADVSSEKTLEAAQSKEAPDPDSPCPDCGFVHEPGESTLCTYIAPNPEIEVLEPEVYTISILKDKIFLADGSYPDDLHITLAKMPFYRINRLPPYLIDEKNNLLKRIWYRGVDAGYAQIISEHLSNIAVGSGLVIKLMAENLEVSKACIAGDPPPFLIYEGGVYKRDRLKLGSTVRYSQVVSEYLSNIVVV